MWNIIKYLDDRGGESGTWSSVAGVLVMLHVNVDPGLWKQVTIWGVAFSALLGILLKEGGTQPFAKVVTDALTAGTTSIKGGTAAVALLVVLGASLVLAACSPSSTAKGSAEAAIALTTLEKAELQYVELPDCPVTAGLCKDPAVKARMKQLDNVAYAAVKAALKSGNASDLVAANAAIAALEASVPMIQQGD